MKYFKKTEELAGYLVTTFYAIGDGRTTRIEISTSSPKDFKVQHWIQELDIAYKLQECTETEFMDRWWDTQSALHFQFKTEAADWIARNIGISEPKS